jgi:hypothetical protein
MVTFFACDNSSGDTEPDDTPSGPVDPVDPGNPDPVDPPEPPQTVTGITIDPPSLEILAGERQLFTAVVSGTAADKTVKWSVAIADEDFYNVKEDGTIISDNKGAGLLVIDAGQYWGTILTVTATSNADPSFSAEATVKVVKPGPRLIWTPSRISVTTGEEGAIEVDDEADVTSVGRLFDTYGKNITIFDGEYVEGQHYYVRRVDNFNQTLDGGTITVTGSADEGTVTVVLSGNVVGDRGHIGITLYQTVLEGADASIIDLESSELVYEITSGTLLTNLNAIQGITLPRRGNAQATEVPLTQVDGADPDPIPITSSISWTGTISGLYTHRSPAVGRVTLTAANGYRFYTLGITESTIKAKFSGGSPELSNVSITSARITFTLTYNITAMTISTADTATTVDADFNTTLRDLFAEDAIAHTKTARSDLWVRGSSNYYSLDRIVEWEGLSGKTFVGGKMAVATVTIPAKPGYTFDGTAINRTDLAAIFTEGNPSIEIISIGDSLVFTLSYYVPTAKIGKTEVVLQMAEKLPVPVAGDQVKTKLKLGATAPFTLVSVTWAGLEEKNKFTAGVEPVATIVLLAKEGYEFLDGAIGSVPDTLEKDTAFTAGEIAENVAAEVQLYLGTSLEITVDYDGVPPLIVASDPLGLTFNKGGTFPTSLAHAGSSIAITSVGFTNTQAISATFAWTAGATSGAIDYTDTGKLAGLITVTPGPAYTFKKYTVSSAEKTGIANDLAIGIKKPALSISTSPAGALLIALDYGTIAKADNSSTIAVAVFGNVKSALDFTAGYDTVGKTLSDFWAEGSGASTATDLKVTADFKWENLDTGANAGKTKVGSTFTLTITVAPAPGYQIPSTIDLTSGTGGVLNGFTATSVTKATPAITTPAEYKDGKVVITVKYTVIT